LNYAVRFSATTSSDLKVLEFLVCLEEVLNLQKSWSSNHGKDLVFAVSLRNYELLKWLIEKPRMIRWETKFDFIALSLNQLSEIQYFLFLVSLVYFIEYP
jgi:hypothetical protein